MKKEITAALVAEHVLIKRMLALIERFAPLTEKGEFTDWQFYLDGADFIRQYADRFHHAKEEDILFEALVKNGMPRENSPVAAMLMEHDLGRGYVKNFADAAAEALAGETGREGTIAFNALAYAALLRDHIAKEDDILYPLAERVIPEGMRGDIIAGYERAEEAVPAGFSENYTRIVAGYEARL